MDIMIARVLVAMLGLAVIVGAVLLVLSFFVAKLRFKRTKRPDDNIAFGEGPFGGGTAP
jgi:heme/copper-type cytochrome/quinol oxidase subunit 2